MNTRIDDKLIYKMIFVYSALLDGWTVKMIDQNEIEFTMSKKDSKKDVNLTNIYKFIKKNTNIKEFMRKNNITVR